MKIKKIIIAIVIILAIVGLIVAKIIADKKNLEKTYEINEVVGKKIEQNFARVKDENGEIFYIPKGFKLSENEAEQKVKDGVVIIDATGDEETNESEFVWISVKSESKEEFDKSFKPYAGYKAGERDAEFENCKNQTEENEAYKKMIESVYNFKGFYIARYEAGVSTKLSTVLNKKEYIDNGTVTNDTTEYANGEYKPISKKGAVVWSYIQWGGSNDEKSTDGFAGNEEKNGAAKVAKNMYKSGNVQSNLCYASQFDAIMNFIDKDYSTGAITEELKIKNSSLVGNYTETIYTSGNDLNYYINNISDLAGNISEWTMEGYSENMRVARGGSTRNNLDISSRIGMYPDNSYIDLGFRVALYIKN